MNNTETIILSDSPEATFEAGRNYASSLKGGDVVGLFGDLGSGKTQFTKGICSAFGINEGVSSPTFIIVNEYAGDATGIAHFDLYRINDPGELKEIGIENYIHDGSICIIEWPELALSFLNDMKKVFFEYGQNENQRIIRIT